ncbi:hypothetical protein Tco_1228094 [Tanacetum coccineum]
MVAYLEKSKGSEGFHQIIDFLTGSHIKNALTECPTLYASPIEQFWQTAALSQNKDVVRGITATIDRTVKVFVSEASIRIHLKLEDSEGLKTLPTAEIFEQLALMGRRSKVVISDDEEDEDDPSMRGISDQPEEQLGVFSAATALADATKRRQSVENVQTYTKKRREVSTGNGRVSTSSRLVSTSSELGSIAGVKAKDKGKEIMHESEPPKKIKKRVRVQISVDEELAKKVFEEEQAKFNAEQEARFKAKQERERIDFEIALELQKQLEEKEEVTAKVYQAHDIDWSDPAAFIPIGSEIEKKVMKRSGFDLQKESLKPVEEEILEDDTEKEELQVYLNIIPEDGSLDVEALATKQDVLELYRLVKERFQTASHEGYDLLLWGDLKTMLEPNEEDEIWRNQQN